MEDEKVTLYVELDVQKMEGEMKALSKAFGSLKKLAGEVGTAMAKAFAPNGKLYFYPSQAFRLHPVREHYGLPFSVRYRLALCPDKGLPGSEIQYQRVLMLIFAS